LIKHIVSIGLVAILAAGPMAARAHVAAEALLKVIAPH